MKFLTLRCKYPQCITKLVHNNLIKESSPPPSQPSSDPFDLALLIYLLIFPPEAHCWDPAVSHQDWESVGSCLFKDIQQELCPLKMDQAAQSQCLAFRKLELFAHQDLKIDSETL